MRWRLASRGARPAADYAARSRPQSELPIFANPQERGSEIGWMIFDLNQNYLRSKLLPRLVIEYLNPGSEAVCGVSVSQAGPHGALIFSTRGTADRAWQPGPMPPPGSSRTKWALRPAAADAGGSGTKRVRRAGRLPCGIGPVPLI